MIDANMKIDRTVTDAERQVATDLADATESKIADIAWINGAEGPVLAVIFGRDNGNQTYIIAGEDFAGLGQNEKEFFAGQISRSLSRVPGNGGA